MIGNILAFVGWKEVIIILAILLLLFGGRKLPELARGLGRGLRNFKDELRGIKKDIEESGDEDESTGEKKDSDN